MRCVTNNYTDPVERTSLPGHGLIHPGSVNKYIPRPSQPSSNQASISIRLTEAQRIATFPQPIAAWNDGRGNSPLEYAAYTLSDRDQLDRHPSESLITSEPPRVMRFLFLSAAYWFHAGTGPPVATGLHSGKSRLYLSGTTCCKPEHSVIGESRFLLFLSATDPGSRYCFSACQLRRPGHFSW